MRKIKIRLPATLTHFAPSLDALGIAVNLYAQVDFTLRSDNQIVIATAKNDTTIKDNAEHPVAKGMSHFFEHIDKPPIGVNISIENEIPIGCGLGDETAFMVAGILGANILAGNPYTRQELIPIASRIVTHTDGAIASIMGGLATSLTDDDILHFRNLPITPFRMLVVVPDIDKFQINGFPELVRYTDMQHNIHHTIMLQHALAEGNMHLLANALHDPIDQPLIQAGNPTFSDIRGHALKSGALAVTTTGQGHAMIVFAEEKQLPELQTNLNTYFDDNDSPTHAIPVAVDTQGVLVSVMQST